MIALAGERPRLPERASVTLDLQDKWSPRIALMRKHLRDDCFALEVIEPPVQPVGDERLIGGQGGEVNAVRAVTPLENERLSGHGIARQPAEQEFPLVQPPPVFSRRLMRVREDRKVEA